MADHGRLRAPSLLHCSLLSSSLPEASQAPLSFMSWVWSHEGLSPLITAFYITGVALCHYACWFIELGSPGLGTRDPACLMLHSAGITSTHHRHSSSTSCLVYPQGMFCPGSVGSPFGPWTLVCWVSFFPSAWGVINSPSLSISPVSPSTGTFLSARSSLQWFLFKNRVEPP